MHHVDCDRKRVLSINRTVMYNGVSGPLKCEVVVKSLCCECTGVYVHVCLYFT